MTITDNVFRVLRHYGLDDSVRVVDDSKPDRVYCTQNDSRLAQFLAQGVKDKTWKRDAPGSAKKFHGPDAIASYREATGCHPAMQITMHADGRVELDLDYAAPVDVVDGLWHSAEVLHNHRSGETTDQEKVARMLDKRFNDDGHHA